MANKNNFRHKFVIFLSFYLVLLVWLLPSWRKKYAYILSFFVFGHIPKRKKPSSFKRCHRNSPCAVTVITVNWVQAQVSQWRDTNLKYMNTLSYELTYKHTMIYLSLWEYFHIKKVKISTPMQGSLRCPYPMLSAAKPITYLSC